ncbi:hypothetical protein C8R45DRAFT_975229 [Mycena sanguinolenta]|nr:hypothetical protein C8R45DRAFT_975229 [Mycena sanguinolenta]
MIDPFTIVGGAAEFTELSVKTASMVKRNLPAQKTESGYEYLYNAVLLLHSTFHDMPVDVRTKLLARYDHLSKIYEEHEHDELKFLNCVKDLRLFETLGQAHQFYHDCKGFHRSVRVSSAGSLARSMHDANKLLVHQISLPPDLLQKLTLPDKDLKTILYVLREALRLEHNSNGNGAVAGDQPVSGGSTQDQNGATTPNPDQKNVDPSETSQPRSENTVHVSVPIPSIPSTAFTACTASSAWQMETVTSTTTTVRTVTRVTAVQEFAGAQSANTTHARLTVATA